MNKRGEDELKLVTYAEKDGILQTGVLNVTEEKIIPLSRIGLCSQDMTEIICCMANAQLFKSVEELRRRDDGVKVSEVKLFAPILYPKQDVICLGVNYKAHADEAAAYEKEAFDLRAQYPVYFSKRVNRATADGEEIPSYKGLVEKLDYEVELAVIIGRDAKNIQKGQAHSYIFGYTILNDMSARDLQTRHKQWYFGKSLDGFTPMGPWIVTADEIAYPPKLDIKSYVNGELRQSSNTENFIFDIDDVLCELSKGVTLKAGTVISMGTPEGVGMGFHPPKFLKSGDIVKCVIENIGTLTNRIE